MSMFTYLEGGCQKWPNSCLRNKSMTPYTTLSIKLWCYEWYNDFKIQYFTTSGKILYFKIIKLLIAP